MEIKKYDDFLNAVSPDIATLEAAMKKMPAENRKTLAIVFNAFGPMSKSFINPLKQLSSAKPDVITELSRMVRGTDEGEQNMKGKFFYSLLHCSAGIELVNFMNKQIRAMGDSAPEKEWIKQMFANAGSQWGMIHHHFVSSNTMPTVSIVVDSLKGSAYFQEMMQQCLIDDIQNLLTYSIALRVILNEALAWADRNMKVAIEVFKNIEASMIKIIKGRSIQTASDEYNHTMNLILYIQKETKCKGADIYLKDLKQPEMTQQSSASMNEILELSKNADIMTQYDSPALRVKPTEPKRQPTKRPAASAPSDFDANDNGSEDLPSPTSNTTSGVMDSQNDMLSTTDATEENDDADERGPSKSMTDIDSIDDNYTGDDDGYDKPTDDTAGGIADGAEDTDDLGDIDDVGDEDE